MGMGIPWEWESHGNPMEMGTNLCKRWEREWEWENYQWEWESKNDHA